MEYELLLEDAKATGRKDPKMELSKVNYLTSNVHNLLVEGRQEEAKRTYETLLDLKGWPDTIDDFRSTGLFGGYAAVLRELTEYEKSEKYMKMVIDYYNEHHDGKIETDVWSRYAFILRKNGKLEEAEEVMRRTVDLSSEKAGKMYFSTGQYLSTLADILIDMGKHEEAAEVHKRARTIAKRYWKGDKAEPMCVVLYLAVETRMAIWEGELDRAEEAANEAVEYMAAHSRPYPEVMSWALMARGRALASKGDSVGAEKAYGEAMVEARKSVPLHHIRAQEIEELRRELG
jgi:tetratricopeptide (TPR) repeat protein